MLKHAEEIDEMCSISCDMNLKEVRPFNYFQQKGAATTSELITVTQLKHRINMERQLDMTLIGLREMNKEQLQSTALNFSQELLHKGKRGAQG
ncbi:Lateral organ boundaries domain family protein [Prunus dulcis]|uniref:Lateral organ boundaries domain family protein n=1 Tax=Prunus dulcis TaxID=3755 RepID=A0A4Y1RHU4_PRUDU|nr:Lateral organ boundaries domain family protein [Prunus dulcis]